MPSTSRRATSRGDGQPLQRRWRIPPPFLRGSEPIEGSLILEEVPGALGLLLWQCARDVTLWAMTAREDREGLFTVEAEPRRLAALLAIGAPAKALEAPLRAAAAMLSHPADTAPEAMMLACQRISQWAEVEGAPATALMFAQAAALAMPASAKVALRVGRLARQRAEYARAEGWLQRSIVLARQSGERETHAWGYTALGYVHHLRGNIPGAERCHLRALRIARRHSLISREGAALHDLFTVALERGSHDAALEWARAAAAVYGPHHPNLHVLAADIAALWIEQGRFALALPVLLRVAQRTEPSRSMGVLSHLARVTGALGDAERFEHYWRGTRAALQAAPVIELAPSVLLNLARGAASLNQLERARETALEARALAARFGENKTTFEADAVLGSLGAERALAIAPVPEPQEEDELTSRFADELVTALSFAAV